MNNKCCPLITKEWKEDIEIEAVDANKEMVFPRGPSRSECEKLCKLTEDEEKSIEMNYSRENIVPFFEELIKVLFGNKNKKKYDSEEFAINISGKAMALLIKDRFSSIGEFEEDEEDLARREGPLVHIGKRANFESSPGEAAEKIKECLELAFWKITFISMGVKSKEDEGWFLEFNFPNEEVKNKGIAYLTIRDDTDDYKHWCNLHQEIALLLKKWNTK